MARCSHPFADVVFRGRQPVCTKCDTELPAFRKEIPPRGMVSAVRDFIRYMKDASEGASQPRTELQLILAMQESLHEYDRIESDTAPDDDAGMQPIGTIPPAPARRPARKRK